METTPSLIYVITQSKEIYFYRETGELITSFLLQNFLIGVDKSLYDIAEVALTIKHYFDDNFILAIENYLVIFNLGFDKRKQNFLINFIKQSQNSYEIYYKRLSRFTQTKEIDIFVT